MSQGLVFFYGSYAHPAGEVFPQSIEVRPVYTERGQRWAKHVRFQVAGDFVKTTPGVDFTQAEITTKLNALNAAYQLDYKDFGFKLADGTTLTNHYVLTDGADNLSGNRVLSRSFGARLPNEYANTRSFSMTLGALLLDSYSQIIYFKETITSQGSGGPYWTYRPLFNGTPVRQDIHATTPIRIIQEGVIVGLQAYPARPNPWWPSEEQEWKRVVTRESGVLHGHPSLSRGTHYTLKYRYEFLRAVPTTQSPSIWG